jgi:hypothetical protein
VGLTQAVTTSEGRYFDYPRYYAQAQAEYRKLKRASRKELGSNNQNKARINREAPEKANKTELNSIEKTAGTPEKGEGFIGSILDRIHKSLGLGGV